MHPEQDSYFAGKNALRVEFAGNAIRRIWLLDDRSPPDNAQIEPQLLTNLFDSSREKRRRVRFDDIPKVLVDAVLSAEDKRFFEHPGFDIVRILGAAWADVRHDAKAQGASTLTMQVARSFFFTTERTWRRKVAETHGFDGTRASLHEKRDFRVVRQRDLSGQPRQLRHSRVCGRRAGLLQ